jgi:hypothetical protein
MESVTFSQVFQEFYIQEGKGVDGGDREIGDHKFDASCVVNLQKFRVNSQTPHIIDCISGSFCYI